MLIFIKQHAQKIAALYIDTTKIMRVIFQKEKDRKKLPLNDKKRIIEMQLHSSRQKKFKQIRTHFQKVCHDKKQTRIHHDQF